LKTMNDTLATFGKTIDTEDDIKAELEDLLNDVLYHLIDFHERELPSMEQVSNYLFNGAGLYDEVEEDEDD